MCFYSLVRCNSNLSLQYILNPVYYCKGGKIQQLTAAYLFSIFLKNHYFMFYLDSVLDIHKH